MLKGRSLKSCVALVAFCFSLLLACISPAYAVNDDQTTISYDDSHGMTLFFCLPTLDPIRQGRSISLPIFSYSGFATLEAGRMTDYPTGFLFKSLEFQPFSYDVTLVLGVTALAVPGASITGTLDYSDSKFTAYYSSDYFRGGDVGTPVIAGWVNNGYMSDGGVGSYLDYRVCSFLLPAGTNGVNFRSTSMWPNWSISAIDGVTPQALMAVVCGYVVHSGDSAVVDKVNAILEQVKLVNGNLISVLSVLNTILSTCNDISANTASILSILDVVSNNIVSLNGKVDDIYTLLKDALSSETAELDKESEKVGDQLLQRVDNEKYWEDKNTDTFNAIGLDGFSFDDGITGALATVGNIFSSIWDAMGSSVVIYTFPLMLGLALVIIGRISRNSGKSGKKGGGDS